VKKSKIKNILQNLWLGIQLIAYGVAFVFISFIPALSTINLYHIKKQIEKKEKYKIRR
jgi:hypothetical protein